MRFIHSRFSLLNSVIVLLGALALVSCSLSPLPQNVELKLRLSDRVAPRTQNLETLDRSNQGSGPSLPTAAGSFDCFFASVSASDTSPELDKNNDLNGVDPVCLGDRVSAMVSASTFFESGVSFSVLAGRGRTVKIFGIMTELGSSCDSKPVKDAFKDGNNPSIFKVGEKTGADILSGGDITVSTVFDSNSSQEDLVGSCGSRVPLYLAGIYSGNENNTGDNDFKGMASALPPGGLSLVTLPSSGTLAKKFTTGDQLPMILAVYGVPEYARQKLAANPSAYTNVVAKIVAHVGQVGQSFSGNCDTTQVPTNHKFDLRILNSITSSSAAQKSVRSSNGSYTLANLKSEFDNVYELSTVNLLHTDPNLIQSTGKLVNSGSIGNGFFISFLVEGRATGGPGDFNPEAPSDTRASHCGALWLESIRAYITP